MIYVLQPESSRRFMRALDLLEHDYEILDCWNSDHQRHQLPQHQDCLLLVEPHFMVNLVRSNGIDHVLRYADRNWIIVGNDIMNSSCWRTFNEIAPAFTDIEKLFEHPRVYRFCDDAAPGEREIPILSSWWYALDIGSTVAPCLNQPVTRQNQFFAVVNAYRSWRQTFLEMIYQQDLCNTNHVVYHGHRGSDDMAAELATHKIMSDWVPRRKPWHQHIEYEAGFINQWYRQYSLELVVESTAHESLVTEKTVRPILAMLPFVCMAGAGHLAYLRSLGFQTFDTHIDESYDQEHDLVSRMHKVSQVLKDLATVHDGFINFYHNTQSIREHNYNHLFWLLGRQNLDYSISLQKFIDQCKIPTSMTPDPSWNTSKSEYYQSMVNSNLNPWLAIDSGKDHYLNKEDV